MRENPELFQRIVWAVVLYLGVLGLGWWMKSTITDINLTYCAILTAWNYVVKE